MTNNEEQLNEKDAKVVNDKTAANDITHIKPFGSVDAQAENENIHQDENTAETVESSSDNSEPPKKSFFRKILDWIIAVGPGFLLCVVIAVPSWFLGKLVPVVGSAVFAILIGMIIAFFKRPKFLEKGIKFTSKKILQASIVFLGFGMNFITVLEVGGNSILVILSTIATSLIVAFILSKVMKIPSNTGILVGVGSSICGGSAIAATSPVIRANDHEVATSISVIFLFNVIAALIFPTIGQAMGLSDQGFGMWAGTAINDTSSVSAAGTTWAGITGSNEALDYAIIVKLTRTLAIIPITLVLAVWQLIKAKRAAKASGGIGGKADFNFNFVKIFPWFIIFFLLAAVVNTWVFSYMEVGSEISSFLSEAGKFMITLAMAAIGLNTNIVKLVKSGWKPILMGLVCWISIAFVSLGVQTALGLL